MQKTETIFFMIVALLFALSAGAPSANAEELLVPTHQIILPEQTGAPVTEQQVGRTDSTQKNKTTPTSLEAEEASGSATERPVPVTTSQKYLSRKKSAVDAKELAKEERIRATTSIVLQELTLNQVRLSKIANKLDTKMAKLHQQGVDVTSPAEGLADARRILSAVKVEIQAIQVSLMPMENTIPPTTQSTRMKLRTLNTDIHLAHQKLLNSVQYLLSKQVTPAPETRQNETSSSTEMISPTLPF